MYLNENYQNINVAFNYIYFYCFGSCEKKFNLYKMVFNIWYQQVFLNLDEKILISSEKVFKDFLEEIYLRGSINSNQSTDDISMEEEEEISNKEIINEISKNILDFSIDENNSIYINHSSLQVKKYYEKFENILSECYIKYLQNKIASSNNPNELIDFLNTFFKTENEHYFYDEKNVKLINRSKKIILTNIVKSFNNFLQNELLKEFDYFFSNLNNYQNFNSKNCVKIDNNLEENVKTAIEKEILNFKNYLYSVAINKIVNFSSDNIYNMINYFIQKSSVIIFVNKLSQFYYEEKNNFSEINKKIEKCLLKKNNCNTEINFNDNQDLKMKIHQNINQANQNGICVNNC
jgi:hypothetical protein